MKTLKLGLPLVFTFGSAVLSAQDANLIGNMRTLDVSPTQLQINVDYTYVGNHGDDTVYLNACALQDDGGQVPGTACELIPIEQGTDTLEFLVEVIIPELKSESSVSAWVSLCMYREFAEPVNGDRGEEFYCEKFPHARSWGVPTSSDPSSPQSDCIEQKSVPVGATCTDFYRQRASWDRETIEKCGLTQVGAYQRALGINAQSWADFLQPCDDSRSPGDASAAGTCMVTVTMTGRYSRYANEVGVFESHDGRRGPLLSRESFARVRDHREGGQELRRARFTLTPGAYVVWPTCGGRDQHGRFGCLVRPAVRETQCRAGRSLTLRFNADSAEY